MMTVVDQVRPWLTPRSAFRRQYPRPRRSPHQEERNRHRDQPASDEHVLAPESVREAPGEIVW